MSDNPNSMDCSDCGATFPDLSDWVEHLTENHPGAWERWYHARWREQADYRRAVTDNRNPRFADFEKHLYIGRVCPECGDYFTTTSGRYYCSEDCRHGEEGGS